MIDASEIAKEKMEVLLRLHSHVDVVGRMASGREVLVLMMNRRDKEGIEVVKLLNDLSVELFHCGEDDVYHDLTYTYDEELGDVTITLRFRTVEEFADAMLVLAGF